MSALACQPAGAFRIIPGGDGHHPVTDDDAGPTDELRHGQHLASDLAAVIPYLLSFLLGTGMENGDAEGSRLVLLAALHGNGMTELIRTEGVGLHQDLQSQLARYFPDIEISL